MADRDRDESRGSDFDLRSGYSDSSEHGEPREDRFGRGFERHEPGRILEERHETRYTQPYDRWSPSDYVFYSGSGYHREFIEPYKEPGRSDPGQGRFTGRGPRGYVRADSRIHEDVCDRLAEAGELDASEIVVAVAQAEVTLEGTVPDRASKRAAEDIVESVRGVRQTHNRLRVEQPGQAVPIGSGEGERQRNREERPDSTKERVRSASVDVTVRGPAGHSGSDVLSPAEIEPLDSGQASPAFPPKSD